jgi:hypothetical protein
MEENCLERLENWFEGYVGPFLETDAEGQKNILLKVEHTRRVCRMMDLLTAGESLSPPDRRLAGAVALLHDVGRFPQYRRWRTFRDSCSDNHARLAVEVIRQERLLHGLPREERLLVEEAVRFHNLLSVPPRIKSPTELFLRLIRDADKLDIWRVFLDVFALPRHERASAALLGLPERATVSRACLAELARGRIVRLDRVQCINDYKLLLISWCYDLNFTTSYRLLREFDYLASLAAELPDDADVRDAIESAREYVAARACPASP